MIPFQAALIRVPVWSPKGPSGELKPVEQLLVEHVCRGDWLDLIPEIPRDKVIDEATMRSWGDSQTCSATVIRDILRGRLAASPDPHGLRLRGAKITGRLDLENLSTEVSFELGDCLLEEGLLARDAHLTFVSLTGCRLEHPSEPALDAGRLTCSVLDLSGTTIIGHADGAVSLRSAHIGGDLGCDGASLRSPAGPALSANGLGRACATPPAPPWTPTACRSTRPCSCMTGSPPPAAAPMWWWSI